MKKAELRQLIISEDPATAEIGLIINSRLNIFPNTARLYRKYKKTNFWDMNKRGGIYASLYRYGKLSAVFCNELKSEWPEMWFMILDERHGFFYNFQNNITEGLKTKARTRKNDFTRYKQYQLLYDMPKEHPRTNIFKFPPKPIKVVSCLGPDMDLNIIETE